MVKQNVARWFDCFIVRPLALIGLLVVLVTATPLVGWYADLLAGGSPAPDGDVLIVLGASYMEKNVIGNDTYWRSVYALRAIRGGHFKHVVLVGYRVAEAMSQFLVFQGVPSGEISLEAQSTSTRENALYTARLLASVPGNRVLMTSDYHMFRARRAFRRAGVDVTPFPIPHSLKLAGSWQTRWSAFLDEASESVKIVYYAARGWI